MTKTLIMLVRVLGLVAIILGSLLWITAHQPYEVPHMAVGICVAAAVFVLSVIAMVKRAVVVGVIGLLLALLLPMVGIMQLPLRYRAMGGIQVAHVAIAISVIGVAERLYSAIRRAA